MSQTPHKPLPLRKVEGRWAGRMDHYRWSICTYERGVIWFYRSDVVGLRVLPEPRFSAVGEWYPLPCFRWVVLYVEPDAREHPAGADW